jgi:hypothetical protein
MTTFIAGNCVLCCFNNEFTRKINKTTCKTDTKGKYFCHFIDFVCDFINLMSKAKNVDNI